jgi:flagellar basal-body rod modification protein FlgD
MVSAIGQDTTTSSSLSTDTATDAASASAAADYDTFLQLLTAQLRNQDPLEPIDSTEFVAQLASFSAVEQQIETNTRLDSLLSLLTENQLDSAVNWIGKEVETTVSEVSYDGESSITFGVEPPAEATSGTLTISDSFGAEIAVIPLSISPGRGSVTWDGVGDDGELAGAGDYGVTVTWLDGEDTVETGSPTLRDTVTEVRLDGDILELTLQSGLTVATESVLAISLPEIEEAAVES